MTFAEWLERSSLDEDPDVVKIDYLAAKAEWELHQFEERKRRGTEVVALARSGGRGPIEALRIQARRWKQMASLLWALVVILAVFWALGYFVAHAGDIVHVLLVLAVIALIYNLFVGGRTTTV